MCPIEVTSNPPRARACCVEAAGVLIVLKDLLIALSSLSQEIEYDNTNSLIFAVFASDLQFARFLYCYKRPTERLTTVNRNDNYLLFIALTKFKLLSFDSKCYCHVTCRFRR